jgi:hypothetical protein
MLLLASFHKCLRVCDLCKELGIIVVAMSFEESARLVGGEEEEVQAIDQSIIADFFQGLPIPAPRGWVPPPKRIGYSR